MSKATTATGAATPVSILRAASPAGPRAGGHLRSLLRSVAWQGSGDTAGLRFARQPGSRWHLCHPACTGTVILARGTIGSQLAARLLWHDPAVQHAHDPLGGIGNRVVMRDQHDRLAACVQAAEQLDNLLAAVGVQRAGGLVGEHERRLVGQRPGDSKPLTLPA